MTDREALCILLVEDSPYDALLLRDCLSELFPGGTILHVETLAEAQTRLRQRTVDLILTDLNLPDSFDVDTARKLVRAAPGVPVIALLGHNPPGLIEQLEKQGVSGHILKQEINSALFSQSMEKMVSQRLRR